MSDEDFIIRQLKSGDLEYIADHMRAADKAELAAASGNRNYLSRLSLSVDLSENVRVVEAEGVPLIVFGIAALTPGSKAIWLLGTTRVNVWRKVLVTEARRVVRDWFQEDPTLNYLTNYTYSKNRVYRRFLEQLGAEVGNAEPVGANGALFHRFNIGRAAYV